MKCKYCKREKSYLINVLSQQFFSNWPCQWWLNVLFYVKVRGLVAEGAVAGRVLLRPFHAQWGGGPGRRARPQQDPRGTFLIELTSLSFYLKLLWFRQGEQGCFLCKLKSKYFWALPYMIVWANWIMAFTFLLVIVDNFNRKLTQNMNFY